MIKLILYYLRFSNLKQKWRSTRDYTMLTDFLEHNMVFRTLSLHFSRKHKETQKHMSKYKMENIWKQIDSKLEQELIYQNKKDQTK